MAKAAPKSVVKEWEYVTLPADPETDLVEFNEKLNDMGKKGWELAGVLPEETASFLVFKRLRET